MSSFGTFPPFRAAGTGSFPAATTQPDREAPLSVMVDPADPSFRNPSAAERPFPFRSAPVLGAPPSIAVNPSPPSVTVDPAEPQAYTPYQPGTLPISAGPQFRSTPTFPNRLAERQSAPQWQSTPQADMSNYPGSLPGSLPPQTLPISQPQAREADWAPPVVRGVAPPVLGAAPRGDTALLGPSDKAATRRKFAIMHMSFLLAIFIPPLMLCINLGLNNNFRYFLGSWPLVTVFVLVFIILVPWIDMRWRPRSWWFLGSVWIIAAFFTLVSGFTRGQTHTVMAALDNQDCYGFTEKRDLQRAYSAVNELYSQCSAHEQVFLGVKECPGYDDLLHDYGREVFYLEALENQFPCAGICHESTRIWSSVGTQAPACGLFVGQWIYGSYIQCMIVFWYSIFIILAAYVVNELIQPFLQEYWEPLLMDKY